MKQGSPAAMRNREPLAAVLDELLPSQGTVLEIACGTGVHASYFAERFPHLFWQPTDIDPAALASTQAWVAEAGRDNLRPPARLDVRWQSWPIDRASAVLSCNMLHISPYPDTAEGLFRGAASVLSAGEPVIVYGPFIRAGVDTAASNLAFDRSLRSRNPAWGLRSLEEVSDLAAGHGLRFQKVIEMPANNVVAVWRRD